jgi:hypothetical protein
LVELANEVERQAMAMKDLIVPAPEMEMVVNSDNDIKLNINAEEYGINPIGHQTLADRMDIPARYYNRMKESNPELLAQNVNSWARHGDNAKVNRMVRTLYGDARAVLSDSYARRDNYDFLSAILPVLQNVGNLTVQSSEITERRMYVQMTFPDIQMEVDLTKGDRKVGDVMQAGLLIQNSEVGYGCREIKFLVHTLSCLNGMVVPRELAGMRSRHIGRKQGDGTFFELSMEAQDADTRALALATRDLVKSIVNRDHLKKVVDTMVETNSRKIGGDVPGAVRQMASTYALNRTEESNVLRHLIEGGDLSQYGMFNAVTRAASDLEDYDRAVELEEIGGKVMMLSASQVRPLLEARPDSGRTLQ